MNSQLLTNDGFVECEALPSFCIIRDDLIKESQAVPVGQHYFNQDNIYQYVWDTDNNFYIVFGGLAQEAYSIDFEFAVSHEDLLKSGRRLAL